MSGEEIKLRIGYIPLVDAAAVVVAADKGFATEEGLDIELVREVSWSNVRDKLNIGQFDAAHLLSPVAIASTLGLGHVRVPIVAPFNLGLNGNAVTVSPELFAALTDAAEGSMEEPMVTARALARVVADCKAQRREPLTFGMTFPFSNHNYQLCLWMAAGGVAPDEDVRLVVLPPPYMVESLVSHHVDGFCVGAPWNSVAVDQGIGRILHFGCEIVARASEKVLAMREHWAMENPDVVRRLVRAHERAARFVADPDNRGEVVALLARRDRLDVTAEVVRRTLEGRLTIAPDGETRTRPDYMVIGRAAASRPDPVQAAWLYAQMVRWGQTPMSPGLLAAAKGVFRPDLYDEAVGDAEAHGLGDPADGIGAFAGAPFDPDNIASYGLAGR